MNNKMLRKLAAGIAAITMLTSAMAGITAMADDVKYGDVNCDGQVDIMDVIRMNKFLLGNIELDEKGKKNADVDCNGVQNSEDSLNILKFVVENIKTLPVTGSNIQPTTEPT